MLEPLRLPDMSGEGGAASPGREGEEVGSGHGGVQSKYSMKDHLTEHELREFKEIFSLVDTVSKTLHAVPSSQALH